MCLPPFVPSFHKTHSLVVSTSQGSRGPVFRGGATDAPSDLTNSALSRSDRAAPEG